MDKIIKTISESGSFRAFVLDSTETVRAAQEYHQTQASSTVALGRTLIASQILAATGCYYYRGRYSRKRQRLRAKSWSGYQENRDW